MPNIVNIQHVAVSSGDKKLVLESNNALSNSCQDDIDALKHRIEQLEKYARKANRKHRMTTHHTRRLKR